MNNEKVKFLLNWNHFAEHLSSCMTRLMTDITFSDIIIATADKHMIYSHRFVLANSSKYFQRLLKQMSRSTGIQLVVALPEIKYEIFKILMNYMYKGETQVPHELLPSVIKAGQFLEINGLVNLNENDNSESNTSLSKYNSGRESHSKCSIYSHKGNDQDGKKFQVQGAHMSSTLRDKTLSRENASNSFTNVFRREKRTRNKSGNNMETLEPSGENGKENRSKLAKSLRPKNLSHEKKDFVIKLPFKRKSSLRDSSKRASSPAPSPSSSSLPSESEILRKIPKKLSSSQDDLQVKIKEEKESENSLSPQNKTQEEENIEEKVTIKEEVPDDVEVVYNELQCEFCHEIYTNPSEWVKHMTQQHEDRGYQTYKDLDKNVGGNAVITCVVCSCVCFSAAEWANHLRVWHSDRELAIANIADTKKNIGKMKKKSGSNKKQ